MADKEAALGADAAALSPEQMEQYQGYLKEAKDATKMGSLEEALRLFNLAGEIFPSDKVKHRIKRIEETLEELAEEKDNEFTDVCNSGLMLYRELHHQLFEHQREGVAFLYSLFRDGKKGGILADDMGLGKTIQIIAFLSGMFDAELVNYVLLVMPTTLISTWTREFAKWTPGIRVKNFHGASKTERTKNLERIQRKTGVIITTYQMLINNWQQLSSLNGREFVWDYLIFDEAHKIKTSASKTAICARSIPAHNRILLTGTPVQNNLQELWSLFDVACQGSLLGTSTTFKMEYENPITRAREKDATPGEKALGFKISENLMTIIKPHFLRRTKEDVQKRTASQPKSNLSEKSQDDDLAPEMPSLSRKNDFIIWVRLTSLQEDIYRKFVSLDHIKELLMETRSPLAELGVLKKLCDHPRLLSARACTLLGLEGGGFSDQDENGTDHYSDINRIGQLPDQTLMEESGKLMFLMALLKRLQREGHQTLVFSQSRKMLDIIERLLTNTHFKILRVDGTIAQLGEREKRISLFQKNKDYSVFLLTTQVGGVGLTLTAATRVVIFDPSWNPATDAQAVDRAYRIGQKENVVIYRLITCGTVEEKIYRRQVFKDSLVRQTTGDKKNPFRYFSKQELRELFVIEDFRLSKTQQQLQSLHSAQRKTDEELDGHIAYLHTLKIAGISDHDLMYTRDAAAHEEAQEMEERRYIQQRVQKAQQLVELESQHNELLLERIRTGTEGSWLRPPIFSSQPKRKPPESKTGQPRSLSPVRRPILSSETVDLAQDDVSSKMTGLVLDDSDEEGETVERSSGKTPKFGAGPSPALPTKKCPRETNRSKDSLMETSTIRIPDSDSEVLRDSVMECSRHPSTSAVVDLTESQPPLPEAEMSVQALDSLASPAGKEAGVRAGASPSIDRPAGTQSASPSVFRSSGLSEIKVRGESLVSSLHYTNDFNLVLEDSVEGAQKPSVASLEGIQNEDLLDGSVNNSKARGDSELLQPDGHHSVRSVHLSDTEGEGESELVVVMGKKKARRIIVSDSEDGEEPEALMSPLRNSGQEFRASTPKWETSKSDPVFSPGALGSGKKPITPPARPDVDLDRVADVEGLEISRRAERIEDGSESEYFEEAEEGSEETGDSEEPAGETGDLEDGPESEFWEEEAEEGSVEEDDYSEEPAGETLGTESESCNFSMSESDAGREGPSAGESSSEASAEEAEALAGEQNDFSPAKMQVEDDISNHLNSVSETDKYDALVKRGKELKGRGNLQEALDCLLQALDLKSDPEIMLLTLGLYKQLK
ncbi:DNA excision repair protein ERCC-6-like isoform X2 [Ornithorhynchus anatinus]|uniref:DNA excision repair protein ERCC-6-like n=1 Tax=Ornithorhynchus anatinus TaxID=9258 RepID=F7G511_ORNAN|nr:DNA excision repair protein ERCC-6-like isoform X2 [Ornithorhynchus anatinus]